MERNYTEKNLEKAILDNILKGFELLINAIKEGKIELNKKDDKILEKLENAKKKLEESGSLNFSTIVELNEILNFKRFYPIFEIGDKLKDVEEIWSKPIEDLGKEFVNKWNLSEDEVKPIVNNYKNVLTLGLLEAIVRKGLEPCESNVIKEIRFNLGRGRLLEEYIQNLVLGWLLEDLIKKWIDIKILSPLKMSGIMKDFKIEYGAHDQERVIKFSGRRITGEPDFKLIIEFPDGSSKTINLEIQRVKKSYTGECNLNGEVKMQIPGHRKQVEEKVLEKGESFLMCLVNVDGGSLGLALNPNKNGKIEEKKSYSYVWAKEFKISEINKILEYFEKLLLEI